MQARNIRIADAVWAVMLGFAISACSAAQPSASSPAPAHGSGGSEKMIEDISASERPASRYDTLVDILRRMSGVDVHRTGGGVIVHIRGVGTSMYDNPEPLCVVDGVPLAVRGITQAMALVRPSEIEQVNVLRDTDATAMFGPRGASGAILITTSRR